MRSQKTWKTGGREAGYIMEDNKDQKKDSWGTEKD